MIEAGPLSKVNLLREFEIKKLSVKQSSDESWRLLWSELNTLNNRKRTQIQQLESQNKKELKFRKIFINEDDEQLTENLSKIQEQIQQTHNNTMLAQGTEQMYLGECRELKKGCISFGKKVSDLNQLLLVIQKQERYAEQTSVSAKQNLLHFFGELQKGNRLVDQECDFLKEELDGVKNVEKNQKQELNQTYKHYVQIQQTLSTKYEKLITTQKAINKLDYELELKRQAKIHSQLLLMELEIVKILSQTFLGQGIMEKSLIAKLQSQEFWFNTGRALILGNIQKIPSNDSSEMSSLPILLEKRSHSLIEEQFSLAKFLKKLSKFFTFCDNDVQSVINQLIHIFNFENVYEVSLKNRYDDLNLKHQSYISYLKGLESTQSQLDQDVKQYLTQSNFVQVIKGDFGQISETSLNSMEYIQDNNQRERTSKVQKVIWRLLTFLTNGLYRWVDMIKNITKLLQKDNELADLCHSIDLQSGELFYSGVDNVRTQNINAVLDRSFNILGKNNKLMQEQKQIIFSFIKNDFILFNWGSIESIEAMLTTKIKEFKQFFESEEHSLENGPNALIKGLSTFICLEFKDLAQDAFTSFQIVFTVLLNRFITLFSGLQSSAKKTKKHQTNLFLPEQKQLLIARRQSMLTSSGEASAQLFDQEKRSTSFLLKQKDSSIKGLFSQAIDFKKQAYLRKCQQYQYYFDEKGAPQVKKNMLDAVYESVFDLEFKITEDDQNQQKEEQDFKENYALIRQKIADQQQSNINKKKDQENQKEQRESKKIKNYMEQSERKLYQEQQMSQLVKLNDKITQTISQIVFKKAKKGPFVKDKLDVIQSLHKNYTTFRSSSSKRFQIQTGDSIQDLQQRSVQFPPSNTSRSTQQQLPTIRTEPDLPSRFYINTGMKKTLSNSQIKMFKKMNSPQPKIFIGSSSPRKSQFTEPSDQLTFDGEMSNRYKRQITQDSRSQYFQQSQKII